MCQQGSFQLGAVTKGSGWNVRLHLYRGRRRLIPQLVIFCFVGFGLAILLLGGTFAIRDDPTQQLPVLVTAALAIVTGGAFAYWLYSNIPKYLALSADGLWLQPIGLQEPRVLEWTNVSSVSIRQTTSSRICARIVGRVPTPAHPKAKARERWLHHKFNERWDCTIYCEDKDASLLLNELYTYVPALLVGYDGVRLRHPQGKE